MKKLILLSLLSAGVSAEVIQVPVTSVTPIYESQRIYDTPTRTCIKREISENTPNIFGGVIGALAGHVITRKLTGSGMNRVLGTAAGAVIGSRIANSTDGRMINDCTITENYHNQNVISGYDVGYTIDGRNMTSRFHYKPGDTVSINIERTYTVLQ
jgi:uncharacterized protein YcfJ